MRILSSIVFCFLSILLAHAGNAKQVFYSPDNSVGFSVYEVGGQLKYEVSYKGKPVILESSLGIDRWKGNMEIERIDSVSVNQDWQPVYGERAVVNDCYKGYTYTLKGKGRGDKLALIVRIYNSGVGFRYKYLHGSYLRIAEEFTTFTVPENTYCWFAPFAQAEHKRMLVKDWPGEAERPLTLQLENGLYASLAEAEMVDYSRTKFVVRKGESNVIRCKMYDAVEDIAPFETPWRVVMVAESPKDLINNPDLDIRAVRKGSDYEAGIHLSGPANNPQALLFSVPAMSQENVLSYIILGRPLGQASSSDAAMLASAATSLGVSNGNAISEQIAGTFGLDSVEFSGEDPDTAAVQIGKYLSPKLYVGYGIGIFEPVSTVQLRYTLSKIWTLQAESGTHSGVDLLYIHER